MSSKFPVSQTRVRSPMGALPADWEVRQLGENAHIKARIGWRGLSADEYTKDGPLLVAGKHIRGARIDWGSCDHISEFRYNESPEIQLRNDDVILSKDGTLGRIGIVERLPRKATINGTMMLVRPDNGVLTSKFLYYCLQGRNFRKFIKEKVSGSSVPHIFQRDMVHLLVPVPPLPEQRKIGAILSSVDDAIEKTQAVIDQVQIVKRGLMQELLTRGLPGRHTRFKQTEIGEIPEEWKVFRLGDLFKLTSGKGIAVRSLDEESSTENPYPVFGGNGVAGFTSSSNAKPPLLVIGRVGENCGTVHCPDQPCWVSDNALYTRDWLGQVNVTFLYGLLQFANLGKLRKKSGQPLVTQGPIHDLQVSLAPLSEQNEMATLLGQFDERLHVEERTLGSLRDAKKALMSVLLTGELRVTPDPEAS